MIRTQGKNMKGFRTEARNEEFIALGSREIVQIIFTKLFILRNLSIGLVANSAREEGTLHVKRVLYS